MMIGGPPPKMMMGTMVVSPSFSVVVHVLEGNVMPFRVSAEKPAGGAVMVAVITAPGDVVGGGGAIVGPELGGLGPLVSGT